MKFIVIGIDDDGRWMFAKEVSKILRNHWIYAGGLRHHELVKGRLPEGSRWIEVKSPLEKTFEQFAGLDEIVIFASGDPLFYGLAGSIRRRWPEVEVEVYPYFSSLQMLARQVVMPYENLRMVSLTGRAWHEFDRALIERCAEIGVLTDRRHTPATIAQRMLDYGFSNYTMYVGEQMGNAEERVRELTLEEAAGMTFVRPNCLILRLTERRERPFGVEDGQLAGLEGRPNMVTKMPVRLLDLSFLELRGKRRLWDIGFCTGAVSVEAKLQFPHIRVTAFEQREECEALIAENARRFGVPGIEVMMGDFLAAELENLEMPDAVFIGGHGGRLSEMMEVLAAEMKSGGVVVFNAVSEESLALFRESAAKCGFREGRVCRVVVDEHNPVTVVSAYLPEY